VVLPLLLQTVAPGIDIHLHGTLASQILSMESFRNQQAPCSDPKHIPDIVSGHTASTAQCSVEQGSCHAGGYLSQELQSVTTMAAPLRPPRKSQKGPKLLQRQESEGEVSSVCKYF
jgi:primosomal replication protein N